MEDVVGYIRLFASEATPDSKLTVARPGPLYRQALARYTSICAGLAPLAPIDHGLIGDSQRDTRQPAPLPCMPAYLIRVPAPSVDGLAKSVSFIPVIGGTYPGGWAVFSGPISVPNNVTFASSYSTMRLSTGQLLFLEVLGWVPICCFASNEHLGQDAIRSFMGACRRRCCL